MKQRSFLVLLLVAWCVLPCVFANAQQGWWHTPGKADVLTTGGIANTLIVQVINLTPYEILLNEDQLPYQYSNPTNLRDMYDSTAMNPDAKKSFMFAPLGVPPRIPRVPPEAFTTTDPNYVNTTTRPYTFVLSWDDRGGNVNDSWMSWTIRDVVCRDPRCAATTKDVALGLFITRENPNNSLTAGDYFHLAKDVLSRVVELVSVIVMPENPVAWTHFILDTGQIAKGATQFAAEQNAGDLGKKWYVAAYPFPAVDSFCATTPPSSASCSPSNSQATDGVEANWSGPNGGWTEQEIVVTIELSRGREPLSSYACYPGNFGRLGSVPVAAVTIMTADEWIYANTTSMAHAIATGAPGPSGGTIPSSRETRSAAQLIHSTLQQSGRQGVLTLYSILRTLNTQQRQMLRDMVTSWRAGNPLTPRQHTFLHMLAVHLRNQMRQAKEG